MPKKKKKDPTRQQQLKQEILFEIYGIIILALSLITMASYGAIGRNLTYLSRFIVGTWDFIIPLMGVGLAIYVIVNRKWPGHWSPRVTGFVIMLLSLLAFNHFLTFQALKDQGMTGSILDTTWNLLLEERQSRLPMDVGSGMVGAIVYSLLYFLFDDTGTIIALGAFVLSGFLLVTGFSFANFFKSIRTGWKNQKKRVKDSLARFVRQQYEQKQKKQKQPAKSKKAPFPQVSLDPIHEPDKPVIYDYEDQAYIQAAQAKNEKNNEQLTLPLEQSGEKKKPNSPPEQEAESVEVRFRSETQMSNYRLPPLKLLYRPKKRSTGEKEDIEHNAATLIRTLSSFGVQAKVTAIHRGPTVTRYEIQPEIGVKVSRIVNLADDIALALAAKDIRIEAPIPGKSAVGIEVPNAEVALVGLRDVLESPSYQEATSKLSIALGKDISGEPIVANLAKMPHLLVAGATGSGKSVCINGIITSLLYKARPDEVKLMMIDPKMVELNVYNGIPHLLAPVVTDPRKAAVALKKVVSEMEKRYELFAKNGARDIERYNQMAAEQNEDGSLMPLPYIVVIVDELADLMMVAPADVEDAICRLAQMARAAGIHLIIATQRPSVDVITGVIKANIPSRIAFAVSSQADSRTILDMGGADKLLGRGDMLYLPIGASKPIRVQGAFLSDEEVESVVKFVKTQQEAKYNEEMIPAASENATVDEIQDELYPQAVQIVLEAKTASVSLIQRRLRVGYTRAARLIDMMEANGIVGPYEGSKPREVLVTLEEFEKKRVAK
ncbi:FtsK/SpoIIIE family DNA translocase [Lihuaxuella thermophila]|uniref:DNA segregation ATPase FtsK/SpoIIIE, S-DNA-T family n=1 Tax=Lihuaxuella thermophila TaxID=1173111 RepID=A0A1H8GKB1_9BACL|nr:DNA translocase FtsK [Lihuaxuella thermophila]SEN44215.1 DNA segregation ATPase FtsK/SpoIIIE, S-DNA-T family [Lihuaxuella thermophila]